MFVTPAYAQAVGTTGGGMGFESLWIFVAIFAIMYFLIIRPQRNQLKQRQEMLNSVRRGDSIVTGGGVIGKVARVNDENGELEVDIAENTRIRVLRSTISDIRSKNEPVSDGKKSSSKEEKTPKKSETTKKKKSVSDQPTKDKSN